ncbi:MAG TPA: hypothetical protein VG028_14400 [Terriglobia bacterium]|nr:hypothetical protein [Terriglobia bacterium]
MREPSFAVPGEAKSFARDARGQPLRFPGTPPVLMAIEAWRSLCARTGCGVTMDNFYSWIRAGKIDAIRVRGNYFVRVRTLNELVKKAFSGKGW